MKKKLIVVSILLIVFTIIGLIFLNKYIIADSSELVSGGMQPLGCSHTLYIEKIVRPATCQEGNIKSKICMNCQKVIETYNDNELIGHSFKEMKIQEATCESGNVWRRICNDCGTIDAEWNDYEAKPHEYTKDKLYKDATTGLSIRMKGCAKCGTYSMEGTTEIVDYTGEATSLDIPMTIAGLDVTSIRDSAFERSYSLTNITIPNSVTSIGDRAFEMCHNLTNITIPNSVTSIGEYAFSDCEKIKSITIPSNVKTIKKGTFQYCNSLEDVRMPNGLTTVEERAFELCNNLNRITIPNTVTTIGKQAFDETGLESIIIPDSVTAIGAGAFEGCYRLESIIIPNKVTTISAGMFLCCFSLESIEIPDSVTTIEDNAFRGCGNLTKMEIPNSVTNISSKAFGEITYTTIECNEGSTAHHYAFDNNISYILCDAQLEVTENYSTKELTNKDVTVNITSNNSPDLVIEGWKSEKSNYKYIFTKTYSTNATEKVTIKDPQGNTKEVTIVVDNIDKVAPVETVSYSTTTPINSSVTATIKVNNTSNIITNTYIIEGNEIKNVKSGITKEEMKKNISTTAQYDILRKDGTKLESNEKVGTGCKVQFATGESYTIIVTGDISGDGEITITDLAKMKQYLIGKLQLEQSYGKAGDINSDEKITITDLAKMKKAIIGLIKM